MTNPILDHAQTTELSEPNTQNLEFKNLNLAELIEKHGLCAFPYSIKMGSQCFNAAKLKRTPKVRDRIEAVRFAKDTFGFEATDAVVAGVASAVLEFGTLTIDEHGDYQLIGNTQIPVDILIDELEYGEFVNLSILMGKPRR